MQSRHPSPTVYDLLAACGPARLASTMSAEEVAAAAAEGRGMHVHIDSVMGSRDISLVEKRDARDVDIVFAKPIPRGMHDIGHDLWDSWNDVLVTLDLVPRKRGPGRPRKRPLPAPPPPETPAWIVAAVEAIARRAADAEAARDGSVAGAPLVDVTVEGDAVTFLFDFMIHFAAQSGSDWYHHHVFSGTARIVEGALTEVATASRLDRNVSEYEYEWAPSEERYDRRAVMRDLAGRR